MPYNRYLNGVIRNEHLSEASGDFESREKVAIFKYDFTELGGAQGAVTLTNNLGKASTLPDNAIITGAHLEVESPALSGGSATIALGITGNTDAFIAATAYNNAAFGAGGISSQANDLPLKLDGAKSVLATIATADLIAGEFRLYVSYIVGA